MLMHDFMDGEGTRALSLDMLKAAVAQLDPPIY
jgi:hypothetical protein